MDVLAIRERLRKAKEAKKVVDGINAPGKKAGRQMKRKHSG